MSIAEFLTFRENAIQGRFLREKVDAKGWEEFRSASARKFRERFSDGVEEHREVLFTIGTRP
jgi:hypothetical protein